MVERKVHVVILDKYLALKQDLRGFEGIRSSQMFDQIERRRTTDQRQMFRQIACVRRQSINARPHQFTHLRRFGRIGKWHTRFKVGKQCGKRWRTATLQQRLNRYHQRQRVAAGAGDQPGRQMCDTSGLDSGKSGEKLSNRRSIETTQHQRAQEHVASQGAQQIVERRVIAQFIGAVCQNEQQRPTRRLTGEAPDRRQRCIIRPLRIIERNDQRECARQRKRQVTQTVDLPVTPFLRRHIRQFGQIRQAFPQHRKKIGDLRQRKLRQMTEATLWYIAQQWTQHLADRSKG
jgi:hypothetical protein